VLPVTLVSVIEKVPAVQLTPVSEALMVLPLPVTVGVPSPLLLSITIADPLRHWNKALEILTLAAPSTRRPSPSREPMRVQGAGGPIVAL
jgi:hypothetical protein